MGKYEKHQRDLFDKTRNRQMERRAVLIILTDEPT